MDNENGRRDSPGSKPNLESPVPPSSSDRQVPQADSPDVTC